MDQISAAPGKNVSSEYLFNDNVCDETGMPPVAVGKAMDRYDAMFEANCNFIFAEGLIFDPKPTIVQERSKFYRDQILINTDILVGFSEYPRPLPNAAQHFLM